MLPVDILKGFSARMHLSSVVESMVTNSNTVSIT